MLSNGLKIKICPNCGKKFKIKYSQRKFCDSVCQNKYYDTHLRNRRKWLRAKKWVCEYCRTINKLNFNITKNYKKWREITCDKCGKKRW